MKTTIVKKNTNVDISLEAEVFRKKSLHYLVCFVEACPLRERCLRYLVGQYASGDAAATSSVNPHYSNVGSENCKLYRPDEYVLKKRGMKNFYYDMPGHIEYAIRRHLLRIFSHRHYYEMRNGTRLITPDEQQRIAEVCRLHGWTGDLHYDGEQKDWLW